MGAVGDLGAYTRFKAAVALGDAAPPTAAPAAAPAAGLGVGLGAGFGVQMAGALADAMRGARRRGGGGAAAAGGFCARAAAGCRPARASVPAAAPRSPPSACPSCQQPVPAGAQLLPGLRRPAGRLWGRPQRPRSAVLRGLRGRGRGPQRNFRMRSRPARCRTLRPGSPSSLADAGPRGGWLTPPAIGPMLGAPGRRAAAGGRRLGRLTCSSSSSSGTAGAGADERLEPRHHDVAPAGAIVRGEAQHSMPRAVELLVESGVDVALEREVGVAHAVPARRRPQRHLDQQVVGREPGAPAAAPRKAADPVAWRR